MIKRMWINQPSTLQNYHELHGVNVLAEFVDGEHCYAVRVYFLSGPVVSQVVTVGCLSEGWKEPEPQRVFVVLDNTVTTAGMGGVFHSAHSTEERAEAIFEKYGAWNRPLFEIEEHILDSK